MNTDDLIARVRMAAFIGDETQTEDYTDAWILNELNDMHRQLYERSIVNARSGYWRKALNVPVIAGTSQYPVPPRAVVGGLDRIDIAFDANLNWVTLPEVSEDEARMWESGSPSEPRAFIMRGDQIVILPVPNANCTLRLTYYSRPSLLMKQQSSTLNGGTVRGLIQAVIPAITGFPGAVNINALPLDQSLATPVAIVTGALVDVVRPTGWHELQVIASPCQVLGLTASFIVGVDVSTIQVGDFLRAAEQTDWPNIPDDYARTLVDATAVKILGQLGDYQKAQVLTDELSADLTRFQDLLSPRVKNTGGIDIVAPFNLYRGSNRNRVVRYP